MELSRIAGRGGEDAVVAAVRGGDGPRASAAGCVRAVAGGGLNGCSAAQDRQGKRVRTNVAAVFSGGVSSIKISCNGSLSHILPSILFGTHVYQDSNFKNFKF
jgi:hypothetical protein